MAVAKAIQIRDVPDAAHAVLRARAAAAGMSMSEYLRAELIALASRPTVAEVLTRANRRAGGPSTGAILDAIHDGRDR